MSIKADQLIVDLQTHSLQHCVTIEASQLEVILKINTTSIAPSRCKVKACVAQQKIQGNNRRVEFYLLLLPMNIIIHSPQISVWVPCGLVSLHTSFFVFPVLIN